MGLDIVFSKERFLIVRSGFFDWVMDCAAEENPGLASIFHEAKAGCVCLDIEELEPLSVRVAVTMTIERTAVAMRRALLAKHEGEGDANPDQDYVDLLDELAAMARVHLRELQNAPSA